MFLIKSHHILIIIYLQNNLKLNIYLSNISIKIRKLTKKEFCNFYDCGTPPLVKKKRWATPVAQILYILCTSRNFGNFWLVCYFITTGETPLSKKNIFMAVRAYRLSIMYPRHYITFL